MTNVFVETLRAPTVPPLIPGIVVEFHVVPLTVAIIEPEAAVDVAGSVALLQLVREMVVKRVVNASEKAVSRVLIFMSNVTIGNTMKYSL